MNDRDRTRRPMSPRKLSWGQWKHVLREVKEGISKDHLSIIAAGVAFYLLLALVPGLVAVISLYGFVADPATVQGHFAALAGAMPQEVHALLMSQMESISAEQGAAGIGAIAGIVLALWASSRATGALMDALNIAWDTPEQRGFLKMAAVRLGLTLAAVLLVLLAIAAIAVLPPLLNALPLPDGVRGALSVLRWPVLLVIGIFAIALLYRYGPSREQPELRSLTWGATIAALVWVGASVLFSVYVANFASYNETYGALGAIVILLLWLWISAFAILLGAEVDAALELEAEQAPEPAQAEERHHRLQPAGRH